MAADLPEFDPQIIERHAEGLLKKSSAIIAGSVVLGVALGAAIGATPLTSFGAGIPVPHVFGFATLLVGGVVGGLVGYVIGDTRSFMYKLQAQIALAQIKAAQDSEAVLGLLRSIVRQGQRQTSTPVAKAAPAAATPPPAPLPSPPAPVAPPPPLPAPTPVLQPLKVAVGAGEVPQPPLTPPLTPPVSA